MTEVILNDECMHCETKECHDGYNFCNQAMKKNSFYKNAKLYKGLEVIQSPTYEELEKEAEGKYIKKSKRLTPTLILTALRLSIPLPTLTTLSMLKCFIKQEKAKSIRKRDFPNTLTLTRLKRQS